MHLTEAGAPTTTESLRKGIKRAKSASSATISSAPVYFSASCTQRLSVCVQRNVAAHLLQIELRYIVRPREMSAMQCFEDRGVGLELVLIAHRSTASCVTSLSARTCITECVQRNVYLRPTIARASIDRRFGDPQEMLLTRLKGGLAVSLRRSNTAETEGRGWLTACRRPKLDSWRNSYLVDKFVTLYPTLCKGLEGQQRCCIDQRKHRCGTATIPVPQPSTMAFWEWHESRTGRFDRNDSRRGGIFL
ncbi:uncharacterized protein CC84DRAFT_1181718 [Paraphaeosphaeria sporulosa]|uniref:Uncharacterized protein n=1 Tax=Paraphaeosphaeria sporulosa TaxID=1460663 RepID=A0A177BVI3_9PLEO|nr:uncharacterized protein CC84DRAFT_1181718 [Paraphaeosphaeria sporulosa]OAF98980.1 hypothetical protein CC84DRAFT_1181718 [Paraphaeosphaeria sporulosa]